MSASCIHLTRLNASETALLLVNIAALIYFWI